MHELRQAFVASNHINVTASALSDDKSGHYKNLYKKAVLSQRWPRDARYK